MRLNPFFNPAARRRLLRYEQEFSDLAMTLIEALRIIDKDVKLNRMKDVGRLYQETFFNQFKHEAAFQRWMQKAPPKALSIEAHYHDECRALRDHKPSPGLAFERSINQPDMPRIEHEYEQFMQAYQQFQNNLVESESRIPPGKFLISPPSRLNCNSSHS